MRIEGFLEAVEVFQVRGWAFDAENPEEHLDLEICLGDEVIASVKANLFRPDLLAGGIGDGRHAFVYNFDMPQTPERLEALSARAATDAGAVVLPRLVEHVPEPDLKVRRVPFGGRSSDPDARPVFVLGAARSGTTAMAQALLQMGYEGEVEGHFFDLLAVWAVGMHKFLEEKSEHRLVWRNRLVARIDADYLDAALDQVFITAAQTAYPSGLWLDKTPNSNMIHLAPRFRRMWPNARFIFMKRRFLENAESQARKFQDYNFKRNCEEWAEVMRAWVTARSELSGAALEIDQRDMAQNPAECAQQVAQLLGWSEEHKSRFADLLAYGWPERTGKGHGMALALTELGWTDQQMLAYESVCAPLMQEYGYLETRGYSKKAKAEIILERGF